MTETPPTAPKRPLTLRDVSEASGVSEMTVSRVLRNRGDVSDATRARVLAAAKELGYVPNKIAGALASQRVNLVAVIIPSADQDRNGETRAAREVAGPVTRMIVRLVSLRD